MPSQPPGPASTGDVFTSERFGQDPFGEDFSGNLGYPEHSDQIGLDPVEVEPVPEPASRRQRGRSRRRREEFQLDETGDSTSFDLDVFDLPAEEMSASAKPKVSLKDRFRAVMMSDLAGKVLVPLAVVVGVIAALRVGTILWAISPFAVGVPVLAGLLFVASRWMKRRKVTKWYDELRDAVDERGLLAEAVWYGPAMSLPAPDEPDRPMWNGILVVYRKGIAWFPTEEAAAKKAMWWKKKFSDVALVHRSAGGSNGVGMDIHLHGGAEVKCHQIPPGGWADGAVEALTDCMYPVLDD